LTNTILSLLRTHLIITFSNNIFLIDGSVPIPLSDIFPYDNTVIACFDIYITICGISLTKKQKRRYIFRAYRHGQFILGQEPLTSKMSYGRDSGYGRGRGRSYGGGGSRAFNRGSPAPKPVEVGKEYEVDVTEISRQGDGIARVQRFVVFVKIGKVKQNVKVKVEQVGNRFATATLVI
jgi:predicted RNA-binding protein with TRAM domain